MDRSLPHRLLITDIGSTTTKSLFFQREGDRYSLLGSAHSPTTVEAPYEDVTIGLIESARKLGEAIGIDLVQDGVLAFDKNLDAFHATSSAGGGLQILVTGLSKYVSAKTAFKAASISGGVIIDVLAADDGRTASQKLIEIEKLRPDMILISGGVDGGDVINVVKTTFLIKSADLKTKFLADAKMPVVYAGNIDARGLISTLLGDDVSLRLVDNLRPDFTTENIEPISEVIHELFIHNVMARAPGYGKVLEWTNAGIMPTPSAVERVLKLIAHEWDVNLIMFDIGGATTDVFTHFRGDYLRTVSANLGMSYSASNVLLEAGLPDIARWMTSDIPEREIRNRILNKCIYPTTLPESETDIEIEHAVAREALGMAMNRHLGYTAKVTEVGFWERMKARLSGSSEVYRPFAEHDHLETGDIDLVIGSGGVLSKAPQRWQAAQILIDAVQPMGVTSIGLDSIFMIPHLGLLAGISEDAAFDCFTRECFMSLATCVGFSGQFRHNRPVARVNYQDDEGAKTFELLPGDLKIIPLDSDSEIQFDVTPSPGIDAGQGRGKRFRQFLKGGEVGVIFDARGRPIHFPTDPNERVALVNKWRDTFSNSSNVL